MTRTSIFAMLVVALSGTFSGIASAQAAAEAALTHALSASAGSKVGNSLGRATSQMATKTGQQTSRAMQSTVSTRIKPGTQRSTVPSSINSSKSLQSATTGSLIQSIQGAEPPQTACTTFAPVAKPDPSQISQKPSSCAFPNVPPDNTYRSFVTLPPAK
jgi:hypothetical protein